MSEERKPNIKFPELLEMTEKAFRESNLYYLSGTLSLLASYFDYYINIDVCNIVYAHYEVSSHYKEPPHSLYITIVLKQRIAIKLSIDRKKDCDEIAMVKVWVLPLE